MRNIPFSPPDIGEGEIEEVCEVLRSGWITTGPKVAQFEKDLKAFTGADGIACLNSATAAEELNFRVLGIKPGDEVIVPPYTYTATASAPLHGGAVIKMVDNQPGKLEYDLDALEMAITPRTKAIVGVDLAGVVADFDALFEIAESKRSIFKPENEIQSLLGRIAVVSDSAHSLGASRDGRNAGTIADFSSFSFHAVKNLTTAEGGAAAWRHIDGIDDEEMYRCYRHFALHGQSRDALSKTKAGAWEYDIIGAWYKCNMTDITAAIGVKQLERYPALLERRKEIIGWYDAACDEIGVEHLEHYSPDHSSSGHLYLTRIPGIDEEKRNELILCLAEKGIATNVHYKPLPMMTAYKNLGFDISDFPNAYDFYKNEITLPLHTKLSDDDIYYVIDGFKSVLKA